MYSTYIYGFRFISYTYITHMHTHTVCNKMNRSMSEMMYRNIVLYKVACLEDLMHFPSVKVIFTSFGLNFANFETAWNIREQK